MRHGKLVFLFSLFIISFSASASTLETTPAGVIIELGIHGGGDEVSRANTTSGEKTVTAGGGISFGLGGYFNISESFSAQLVFGIKEDAINGSNGNIKFSRNTLDFMFYANLGEILSLGIGPTYHTSVELSSDGVGSQYASDTSFDDAVGVIADAKFDLGEPGKNFIALRLTYIEYKTSETTLAEQTYNGNSFGFLWGFRF